MTKAIVTLRANSEESREAVVKSTKSLEVTKREIRYSAQEIRDRDDSEELGYDEVAKLLSEKTGFSVVVAPKFEVKVE